VTLRLQFLQTTHLDRPLKQKDSIFQLPWAYSKSNWCLTLQLKI